MNITINKRKIYNSFIQQNPIRKQSLFKQMFNIFIGEQKLREQLLRQ